MKIKLIENNIKVAGAKFNTADRPKKFRAFLKLC